MRAYEFETYDVFTSDKFKGNPLAVIMDAQGLSTEEMQTITREFNLSESTFVLPPEDSNNTARVRIFTPGYEMPYAGHPTVGTAVAIARQRSLEGELRLELNAGLFPVEVSLNGDSGFGEFENPNLPKETGTVPSAEMLEAALSLPSGTLDRGAHEARCVGAGVDYYYLCAPLGVVREAKINSAAFEALKLDDTVGLYLYAQGGEAPGADYHARMFAPNAGISEDPATGSAAAAFPGQLLLSGALREGETRLVIEQGYEMGRPSRINARVQVTNNVIDSVRIGGDAVSVQKGQIFV